MNEQITLLLGLLLVHFIADFYLQPLTWVHDRNRRHARSLKLVFHTLIHGALSSVILLMWEWHFGLGELLPVVLCSLVIMSTHWLIDVTKSYTNHGIVPFFIDQIAHLCVIVAICIALSEATSLNEWFSALLANQQTYVVLLAYLLVFNPCSVAIRMLLERWQLPQVTSSDASLPQAGHSIGLLERALMLTFILIDELAGVGFVLAAKSIFRFGDLANAQEKHLTEYVMLGTLLSVVFTLAIGLSAKYFITL
ncbi:DUF3307 domain-containing protein [Pseudoalteromonas sp. SSDWG2]|uniref:DUF3307 domain-containing protein n=1 Tax=Pseudoalteromonas sp. SSDWG2 TaxID=3139391 RepID=UPI003BAAA112